MGALDSFHVKVEAACGWVGADGSVSRVGEGACLLTADACDIVLVAAEGLAFVGSGLMSVCERLAV